MFLSYNCVEFVILEVILMEATIDVEANNAQVVGSGHIRDVALCTLALLHPKPRAFPVWITGAQASPCTRTSEHPAQPRHSLHMVQRCWVLSCVLIALVISGRDPLQAVILL